MAPAILQAIPKTLLLAASFPQYSKKEKKLALTHRHKIPRPRYLFNKYNRPSL